MTPAAATTGATPPHPGGAPSIATPPRRAGSIRRTTTHDAIWPDGFEAPVQVAAIGRDLLTASDGGACIVDTARIDLSVRHAGGTILAIACHPDTPEVASFVGACVLGGFRRTVEQAIPGEAQSHRLRFQLFDELPAAVLASGRALRAAGVPMKMGAGPLPVDICAGWAAGGTLLAGINEFGPPMCEGLDAPSLDRDDDLLAWHDAPPLPPHATRRRRRLDVWEQDGRGWIDCFFRDSHADGDGRETIVHEWAVTAEFDPHTRLFVAAEAEMGPLPYVECPGAAPSAARLAGVPIDGVRRMVRSGFTGPSTCTHLNDTLRSLEDVGALLDRVRARG